MTLGDTVSLSLRNLRQSKLRTALTVLGVSIGIASLAGMVSLGVGLQDQVIGRFAQSGLFDAITITSPSLLGGAAALLSGRGGIAGLRGLRGRGAPGEKASSAPVLNDESLKQISAMENVREVYPNLRFPVEVTLGDFSRTLTASGLPMSAKREEAFQKFSYGEFFASESDKTCILAPDLASGIAVPDQASLIGKNLTLSYPATRSSNSASPAGFQVQRVDVQCRITGIVERGPGAFALGGGPPVTLMIPLGMAKTIDEEIVTSATAFLRDPSEPKSYASLTVKVSQAQFTQDVEDRLRQKGYTVLSINDALRGAKNAFIVLDIFLSLIGSIALAVSSLGIVNTMVMSILERTREIGIMKAIGASDNDIRRIFLIEASVIGLLGGLSGILLGWVVGQVINFGANLYIRSQGGTPGTLFSLPLWLTVGAIVFSILVSLVAGSYPASRAARLDPIHALRHD